MRIHLYNIFLIISLFVTLFAQTTGKIKGYVSDSSGKPLKGANITVEGTTWGAEVDKDGYYYILGIRAGTYTLVMNNIGYPPQKIKDVKVRVGLTTTQDFHGIDYLTPLRDLSKQNFLILPDNEKIDNNIVISKENINDSDKEGFTPLLGLFYPNYDFLNKWEPDSLSNKAHRLINIGANVNIQNNYGVTPLMKACDLGFINVVELLLKNKADTELKNYLDQTAIFYAVKSGNIKIVDLLIQNKVKTNLKDNTGRKPIFYAKNNHIIDHLAEVSDLSKNEKFLLSIIKNDVAELKEILKKNININFTFKDNKSALMYACEIGNTDIERLLIDKKIKINATDNEGKNALLFCSDSNSKTINMLIEAGIELNLQNKRKETALILASKHNNLEAVETLMLKGADETVKDIYNKTALEWAVKNEFKSLIFSIIKLSKNEGYKNQLIFWSIENDQLEILRYLIVNGLNINIIDTNKQSPLYLSVSKAKDDVSNFLLHNGADPNLSDNGKASVLMCAIEVVGKQKPKSLLAEEIIIIDSLIKFGADVNYRSNLGSPLTIAIDKNKIELAKLLIEKGADINAVDYYRNNALQILVDKNSDRKDIIELMSYFEKHGAKLDWKNRNNSSIFLSAVNSNKFQIVKYLYEKIDNIDFNEIDDHDRCALSIAVDRNNLEIVNFLLDNRADVNITKKYKKSNYNLPVLYYAIIRSDEITLLLLKHGIDIKVKFHNEDTPLMLACQYKRIETIKKLLELGVDPYEKDKNGKTAFDHARNNQDILEILNTYKKK